MPILDVAQKTCQKQETIGRGGEKGSEISVLITRDDDDEILYSEIVNAASSLQNTQVTCYTQ